MMLLASSLRASIGLCIKASRSNVARDVSSLSCTDEWERLSLEIANGGYSKRKYKKKLSQKLTISYVLCAGNHSIYKPNTQCNSDCSILEGTENKCWLTRTKFKTQVVGQSLFHRVHPNDNTSRRTELTIWNSTSHASSLSDPGTRMLVVPSTW